MSKLSVLVVTTAAVLTVAACQGSYPKALTMQEQNNSGQSGTVILAEKDGQTEVVIDMKPGPAGVAQPAHMHEGTCANLNPAPKFPLSDVVDGKSTTTVDVDPDTLGKTPHAVNVHRSAQEVRTFVSCADVEK